MSTATCKVGKRGAVVIPVAFHRRFGMEEGTLVIAEERAEFLLSNAVDAAGYAQARADVRTMGLDPDDIPHAKPDGC